MFLAAGHLTGAAFSLTIQFPDMFCLKRVYKDKRGRSTDQQPGTKGAPRPVDKPRINRLSTGDFVPACGLNRVSLVGASEGMFRTGFFVALEGTRDGCV